jgi:hypothetical protein
MIDNTVLFQIVSLQRRLITSYRLQHPEVDTSKWLLGIPRRSELLIDGESWEVLRHGVGLQFNRRNPAPHLIVDMHEEFDVPDRLDAWRVQQFVESLGRVIEFDEVEVALRNAQESGVLIAMENGSYRLQQ